MNLHFSRKLFSLLPQNYQFSISSTRVLASLLFSTKTPTKPLSSSHSTTLCRRIEAIRDPRVSIVPVLDQWVKEGNTVDKHHLVSLVRLMKDYKRFKHALEVFISQSPSFFDFFLLIIDCFMCTLWVKYRDCCGNLLNYSWWNWIWGKVSAFGRHVIYWICVSLNMIQKFENFSYI